ncbi:hypothetical protein JL720_5073 [Aureococcus anophagefferens]|nr:hypothetical protein JL720_5073 [Aureococcus anophagefferens]
MTTMTTAQTPEQLLAGLKEDETALEAELEAKAQHLQRVRHCIRLLEAGAAPEAPAVAVRAPPSPAEAPLAAAPGGQPAGAPRAPVRASPRGRASELDAVGADPVGMFQRLPADTFFFIFQSALTIDDFASLSCACKDIATVSASKKLDETKRKLLWRDAIANDAAAFMTERGRYPTATCCALSPDGARVGG